LKVFWKAHGDARKPLVAWIKEVEHARWEGPAEVRARYRSVDFVNDKVVFNIGGNKYRLIVRLAYIRRPVRHSSVERNRFRALHRDP